MNKIILSILALCLTVSVMAQEEAPVLTGKKGTPILPQAGDYAIGVDAAPYLEYLGNMFNQTENNSLDLGSQTLYGRYFLDDNTAVRVALMINNGSNKYNYYVRDDFAYYNDPTSNAQVVDVENYKYNEFNLGVAYQKFRGYGRLRGFYGAQIGIGISSDKYEYTYGNPITEINQAPSSNWGSNAVRDLEYNYGTTTSFYLGGIAGVEYYFAPKICIGGEINLSYVYTSQSQSNSKYEQWNGSNVETKTELESPGNSYSNLETYRPSTYGGLYLMFHF